MNMMLQKLIGFVFSPIAFGLGFLSPLFAQTLTALGWSNGFMSIALGLVLGLGLGVMAQVRGSWVWVKP